ncbi:ferric-dicitrate binding protein FerR (iron transport regulator) [Actinoplanes tereljensis]|uniref:LytR/CpsA/Psr regulator C-terminal domain-containing protein n=1 Tax=Paractinoplanes tereljensis TaxID=571912 RepID=A0A919NJ50_9ACTN|nr:LytR C-terminal domain-containing protein [Actinoplanes tereljensis]GIF19153.1 hypothetical protein Ate02nite_18830 [Actinoplanes tereljensis]
MSRPVEELLRELETDVQNLRVLPAAAVRERGRRRGRRQTAALLVAGAVIATAGGIAVDRSLGGSTVAQTAEQRAAIDPCLLALPDNPAAVRIRVLDGGAAVGVADAAVAELRTRSFSVPAETAGATADRALGAATLVYGPAAIGAASLLQAEVRGEVSMQFDPARHDDTIDLVLGPAFTRLATSTELNQNLVSAGEPTAPPECSTVVSRTQNR